MNALRTVILILLALPLSGAAQWGLSSPDSAQCQMSNTLLPTAQTHWCPLTATVLVTSGTLFSVQPELHSLCVSVRDAVQLDGHARLHFDDYCQFLPAIAPFALNLCGIKGRHSMKQLTLLTASSYLLSMGTVEAVKYSLRKPRPDGRGRTSFPSGHTCFAFTGAELLRREYGADHPAIAVAGYAVATVVGLMRVYNNRHWLSDVAAGAGLGMLGVSLTYWLSEQLAPPKSRPTASMW